MWWTESIRLPQVNAFIIKMVYLDIEVQKHSCMSCIVMNKNVLVCILDLDHALVLIPTRMYLSLFNISSLLMRICSNEMFADYILTLQKSWAWLILPLSPQFWVRLSSVEQCSCERGTRTPGFLSAFCWPWSAFTRQTTVYCWELLSQPHPSWLPGSSTQLRCCYLLWPLQMSWALSGQCWLLCMANPPLPSLIDSSVFSSFNHLRLCSQSLLLRKLTHIQTHSPPCLVLCSPLHQLPVQPSPLKTPHRPLLICLPPPGSLHHPLQVHISSLTLVWHSLAHKFNHREHINQPSKRPLPCLARLVSDRWDFSCILPVQL